MSNNELKDTFFSKNLSLNCTGRLLDLAKPRVMGILNVTPDSFHDGGKYIDIDFALRKIEEMIEHGADIIDIGAASSRPGADSITQEMEIDRLSSLLPRLRAEFPHTIFSIDTYHSQVAKFAVEGFGIDMINDISAGDADPEMIPLIAALRVPYIIMHMQGTPESMQENPSYTNVSDEVIRYLSSKVFELRKHGINDIIIDPGFGFGKSMDHNYELLAKLENLRMFELPMLAGISRKSMIYNLLNSSSEEALNGTTAIHMLLLQKGVQILRVHDVKEAKEVISIFMEMRDKIA